jgi:hypothetical protein
LLFHVLGPPLAWAEDASYPIHGDPRSIVPFSVANGTFHQLSLGNSTIEADVGGSHQSVRGLRFLIRNPYSVPVALKLEEIRNPGGLAWSQTKRWQDEVYAHNADFGIDGFWYLAWRKWRVGVSISGVEIYPCWGTAQYVIHPTGASQQYYCYDEPKPDAASWYDEQLPYGDQAATLYMVPFANPIVTGAERERAAQTVDSAGNPYVVVPAASATTPGSIVVYVERPLFGNALSWETLGAASNGYRRVKADFYAGVSYVTCCDSQRCSLCANYQAHRQTSKLVWANETFAGVMPLRSSALRADGKALGELRDFAAPNFSRTFTH